MSGTRRGRRRRGSGTNSRRRAATSYEPTDRPAPGQAYVSCGHEGLEHWWRTRIENAWHLGDLEAVWFGMCGDCFAGGLDGLWERIRVCGGGRFAG